MSGLPAAAASQKFWKWANDGVVHLADLDMFVLDRAVVRYRRPLRDEVVAGELLAVAKHERAENGRGSTGGSGCWRRTMVGRDRALHAFRKNRPRRWPRPARRAWSCSRKMPPAPTTRGRESQSRGQQH